LVTLIYAVVAFWLINTSYDAGSARLAPILEGVANLPDSFSIWLTRITTDKSEVMSPPSLRISRKITGVIWSGSPLTKFEEPT